MPAFIPIKESYLKSPVYKHRYKDRPKPLRCCVIKKNGEQCKKYAFVGMKCCESHGGKAALANLKHGGCSKSLKIKIMYYLNSLSIKEKRGVENQDYSDSSVIDSQLKLTDILLARVINYLNTCQNKLINIEIELEKAEPSNRLLIEKLTKEKIEVDKNILSAHRVIQQHQKTADTLLRTRQVLKHEIDAAGAIDKMAANLEGNKIEMLAECIESFIKAGIVDNIDQLKLLVESKTQETVEIIEYEYEGE